MDKKTAICIPSRNRPHLLRVLVDNLRESTPEDHALYFAIEDDKSAEILTELKVTYWKMPGTTMPEKINFLASVTTEPFLYGGQDDSFFSPDWLTPARDAADEINGIAVVSDGCGGWPTGLLSRTYMDTEGVCVDTPNVIIYPGYWHYFSEIEVFETAKYRDRLAKVFDSVVYHRHWNVGQAPLDTTYEMNREHFGEDRFLFRHRRYLWHPEAKPLLTP